MDVLAGLSWWSETSILIIPDNQAEDEGICFEAQLTSGSSSLLSAGSNDFVMKLVDQKQWKFQCLRGSNCTLDFSEGIYHLGDEAFLHAEEDGGCLPWCEVMMSGKPLNESNLSGNPPVATFESTQTVHLQLPSRSPPGHYPVCISLAE